MSFAEDNRPHVQINEEGGDPLLELRYAQPSVSVDTSARFVTHEVIGDTTVRQKIGEDPDEISINGHCTEDEANQVDALRNQDLVEVISSRWEGLAQVASTSTRPIADGGGKDARGDWIHEFTIELVEVDTGGEDEMTALFWQNQV